MKTLIRFRYIKGIALLCGFLFSAICARPQFTNSINIGSVQQNTNPLTTFNAWLVTNMSPDMVNSFCSGNTAMTQPPPAGPALPATVIGQPATLLPVPYPSWPAGSYLSCYPANTIYTPRPLVSNFNCSTTVRRWFNVCSNTNQQVTINLSMQCDDAVMSVVVDGTTTLLTGPVPGLGAPIPVNSTLTLAPGLHTIDIIAADWQNTGGVYYNVGGVQRQWNPFGISIAGTVSTTGNFLLNSNNPTVDPILADRDTVCIGNTATFSSGPAGGTWSSSDNGIATVDPNGIVTGVAQGTANITYTIAQGQCAASSMRQVVVTNCHCEDSCNWSLTGNSFVRPWYFIGSINNADFMVRTNNTERMRVSAAGNVGIGTTSPAKPLEVNGEARIGLLPIASNTDRIVFANASGDLRSLSPTGNTNQYLSGNGTWETITGGGSGLLYANYGLTAIGNTVYLGDVCGNGGGRFRNSREINMNGYNLYFTSEKDGKLFMGPGYSNDRDCRPLFSRLEISSIGLPAVNDYVSPDPSTSGLRFTDLTARETPIDNKFGGVLSLDEDGDVIWVKSCCDLGPVPEVQLKDITDRLTKLENELRATKKEAEVLKGQLSQMDVVLEQNNIIVLNQNVPNPFNENTTITYQLPQVFKQAQLIFTTTNGEVVKIIDLKQQGKGAVNVFARGLSNGLYTYTLIVDGKTIATKKMVKQ